MFTSSDIEPVVAAVLAAPPRLGPVRLLAVDGPSGSGKSTYAAALLAAFAATPGMGRGLTQVGPQPLAPHAPAPRAPDPQTPDPQTPDPQTPDSQAPALHAPDPHAPDPQAPVPHASAPQTPDPRGPAPLASGSPGVGSPASASRAGGLPGSGLCAPGPHASVPGVLGVGGPGVGEPPGKGVVLVGTDDFATWDDPVAWWARLVDGVLRPFAHGRVGRYRRTEWSGGEPHPGAWVTIATPAVLILEGVSAGRRSIYDALSALVWLELPAEERLGRAVARDGESSRESLTTWQNFESGWFAVDGTARRATHRPPIGPPPSGNRTNGASPSR